MPIIPLRTALILDAVASGTTGLLAIVASGFLGWLLELPAGLLAIVASGFLGWLLELPSGLLLGAGLVLVPYVLFVIYTATRASIPHGAVWAVIVANVLWAAASVLLLLSGWVAPNALGVAFVLAQGAVVALFGQLQVMALRRPLAAA